MRTTTRTDAAALYRAGASFSAIHDALVAQGAEPEQAIRDAVDGVLTVWDEWMNGGNDGQARTRTEAD